MRFENDRDRTEQFRVASLVEVAWNSRVERTGSLATFDYRVMRRDRHVLSIEVKRAYLAHAASPRKILSAYKARLLMAMRPPALLVVAWDDFIGWYPAAAFDIEHTRIGGRDPRPGAAHDREAVIDIPCAVFRPLTEWPREIEIGRVSNGSSGRT